MQVSEPKPNNLFRPGRIQRSAQIKLAVSMHHNTLNELQKGKWFLLDLLHQISITKCIFPILYIFLYAFLCCMFIL